MRTKTLDCKLAYSTMQKSPSSSSSSLTSNVPPIGVHFTDPVRLLLKAHKLRKLCCNSRVNLPSKGLAQSVICNVEDEVVSES